MPRKSKTKLSGTTRHRVLGENDRKRVSKGESMYEYGEQKRPLNISLTFTAVEILDEAAQKSGLSKSEFIERWLRNL